MTPRSPWRDSALPVVFGDELPPILRHHAHRRSWALSKRWRPITNDGAVNKPRGGVWCGVAEPAPGKWRAIPRTSSLTEFCEYDCPGGARPWQTQLHPLPDAAFVKIDSAADAVALYDAFPADEHPVHVLLAEHGMGSSLYSKMINWQAVLDGGIAGIWLTDRGQMETRLPDKSIVPSLYGWDVATVWFGRPAYRVSRITKAVPVPWVEKPLFSLSEFAAYVRMVTGEQPWDEELRARMEAEYGEPGSSPDEYRGYGDEEPPQV